MDLYQELILEHSKRPQHAGLREPFEAEVHHVNPTCGDEVTMRLHVVGDGANAVVEDVSYDALGCSISMASVSILAEETIGHPLSEALTTYEAMKAMLAAARDEGVSFGSRGNLIILAPPLVIAESDLAQALGVLDRLLARFFPASLERAS